MNKDAKGNDQVEKSSNKSTQFTVRNVPRHIARAIRAKASLAHKSLNRTLVEALASQVGVGEEDETIFDDLDYLSGKWEDDPEFDAAVADQDKVDGQLWK